MIYLNTISQTYEGSTPTSQESRSSIFHIFKWVSLYNLKCCICVLAIAALTAHPVNPGIGEQLTIKPASENMSLCLPLLFLFHPPEIKGKRWTPNEIFTNSDSPLLKNQSVKQLYIGNAWTMLNSCMKVRCFTHRMEFNAWWFCTEVHMKQFCSK